MVQAAALMGTEGQSTTQNVAASTKSKSSDISFEKVMSSSLSTDVRNQSYSNSSKTVGVTDANKTKTDTSKQDASSANNVRNTKTENTKTENTKTENAENVKTPEMEKQLEDLTEKVKEQLQKIFGVSEEELEEAMAALGLGMLDLLQPKQLTQLVAEVKGQGDLMSVLVNEDLSSGLQDLLGFVNDELKQIADSFGMSMEKLEQMIDASVQKGMQMPEDTNEEAIKLNGTPKEQQEISIQSSEVEEADDDVKSMADVLESKLTTDGDAKDAGTAFSKNGSETRAGTEVKLDTAVQNNMAQSITESFQQVMVNLDEGISAVEIVRQVVDAVHVTATEQLKSIEIQLNPENLGKVVMNVSARNGIVTAQLVAENEQVKRALESQMVTLKERFENQGIKVEAVEVTVQSHSFEANQNLKGNDSEQQKEGKKTLRHLSLDSLDDLEDDEMSDEELRAKDLINNGVSSVEYSA